MSLRKKALFFFIPILLWPLASTLIYAEHSPSPWGNPPQKRNLSNGMTWLYQKDDSSAITMVCLLIQGGKMLEPAPKEGLAYLTTRLAIEIPDHGKVQSLMSLSSHFSMNAKGDYSLITMACLTESLEETLKIMAKIIRDPLFSGIRIKWIKERMQYQRKREEDDPRFLAHQAFLETLLAEKGYGGSVLGSEESLNNIKKEDIVNFYKNFYRGSNMILAVSSDLEEEEILNLCSEYFAEFPEGEAPKIEPATLSKEVEKKISIAKDTKQSFVSVGYLLPELTPKNFALAFLLENLLGKGAGSRLWPLRSTEKLAYVVDARATQMKEGGIIEAFLETDHTKKETAMEALRKVLEELFQEGADEDELEMTKIQAKASFLRTNETKEERTQNLAVLEALGLGYEFLTHLFKEIEDITLEEMNAYIEDILHPEKGVEIVVGPEDKVQN